MKRPNVKNYDLKPYGYIKDLTDYVDFLESKIQELSKHDNITQIEQFYCVSSNSLVYGNSCEKWCGDENCKALCKQ